MEGEGVGTLGKFILAGGGGEFEIMVGEWCKKMAICKRDQFYY